ncbi:MAG TPA: GNAT family N-acetyltransferase [Arthrobacter sp.]|nr:GNAT family N-acetyltransferase [Arthrobacter sp.]
MVTLRTLTALDMEDSRFFVLLREAAGQNDDQLRSLIADRLPAMGKTGIFEGGNLIAFAAYQDENDHIVLEYIAVDAAYRGRGYGSLLVQEILTAHAGTSLLAETDDDAVEFYRRLGFRITQRADDPRWPGIQRYRCLRPDSPVDGHRRL